MPKYRLRDSSLKDTEECYANAAFRYSGEDETKSSYSPRELDNVIIEPEDKTSFSSKKDKTRKTKRRPNLLRIGQLFRFASRRDRILIFIGLIAGGLEGSALPVMLILYGKMITTFIQQAKIYNNLNSWLPAWRETCYNMTTNVSCVDITSDFIQHNPNPVQQVITLCKALSYPVGCDFVHDINTDEERPFLKQISVFTIYFAILGGLVFILEYVEVLCWKISAYNQRYRIQKEAFWSILKQDIAWFDTSSTGEMNTRLSDDINKVEIGIGYKMGFFFQMSTSFVIGLCVALYYSWKLALSVICVIPLMALSGMLLTRVTTVMTQKELTAYAKAGAVAEEVFGTVRTVMAFGGQEKECERYNANLIDAKKLGVKKGVFTGLSFGMITFFIYSMNSIAYWYGSQLVFDGVIASGTVFTVFITLMVGIFNLLNAIPSLEHISIARAAAYEVFNIIDTKPSIDSSSAGGRTAEVISGNVEFRNVSFSYPSRPDVKVLRGVSMRIDAGQTVALVGSSGCGKSTVVQLLQRFYDPSGGQILMDGIDICEFNVKWLRQQIGVVSQEPVLFSRTIIENIRLGKEDITDEDVVKACKEANAHDFVQALPKKYDTLVGERGAQLSGGQKQRIAIARALVRNPKILLLDEATSSLDAESEATVQEALDKVRAGRTILVVAHRLSTIRGADVIVGLEDGLVKEQGTHDFLMTKQGLYYQLVMNQEEELPKASLMRILRLNRVLLPANILGCLFAMAVGVIQPLSAIFVSQILRDVAFFDDYSNSVGSLSTRLAVDASAVKGAVGTPLSTFFRAIASIGVGFVIGFIYSWELTLLILAIAPMVFIGGYIQVKRKSGNERHGKSYTEQAGQIVIEVTENIRTVATLTKEDRFFNEYVELISQEFRRNKKEVHVDAAVSAFSNAMLYIAFAACFGLGGYLVEYRGLQYYDLFRVFAAIVFSAQQVGQATSFAPDYGKAKVAAIRLFKLLDQKPAIECSDAKGKHLSECHGSVKLTDVNFAYQSRPGVMVLKNLDLSVNQGKSLALVGPSGCGKSTIVQLLERFYDPLKGSVTVDDHDIRELNLQWLRRQIGIVSQEPVLFDISICGNIAYGDNSRQVPMAEIIEAARNANIHSFIESLPQVR
ncbi:hypothetical protein LSH36_676g01059 [Paralvinella palmiformis]|uniref:Uncharacterized protein n=1 Tax=Paralvinella palmiformis TaxID=53620 RepID=A0AAD9MU51_9ANNE|nr:hypothetical protein LSH36_676g01059 [Paralvinella palmiformis]